VTASFDSSAPDNRSGNLSITIVPATMAHFRQVLDDHPRYWGDRDMRGLHVAALVHEFPTTSLVALDDEGIRGYLFGFVTPDRVAYIHLIATRDDTRGTGLGRQLYHAFADAARKQGALTLKAITSFDNKSSIAFHRSLGFSGREVEGYGGPGYDRIVFTRDLPPTPTPHT
jgi:GNAT superfamily N-acetyltransferase